MYSISALACFLVLLVYYATGRHRRSAISITCKRVWSDLLMFVACAIRAVVGLGDRAYVDEQQTLIFYNCQYSGVGPVAMRLASTLWFGVFMWETVRALRTPFVFRTGHATRVPYHMFVYGVTLVAVITVYFPPNGGEYHAGTEWGANEVANCGLVAHPDPGISTYSVILVFVPYTVVVIMSLVLLRQARRALQAGCRRTMLRRNQHMTRLTFQISVW